MRARVVDVSMRGVADAVDYGARLLVGESVRLRPLRDDDLPVLDRWWQNEATLALQADAVRPGPEGSSESMFRSWSANGSDGGVGFSIERLAPTELVGHATLWGATVRGRCASLAIMLGHEHSGQRLGTDALTVLLRYGFEEMGLHRIELRTWAFNTRAINVYRRVGFVEEGRRREVTFHAGTFHDEVQMGILESEWRSRTDRDS